MRVVGPPAGCAKRITLNLVLLVCILTTSLGTAACRSDGIRVRSWEDAIRFSQAELDAAGNLEGRLDGYARSATNLSEKIGFLDQARLALEVIGRLRDVRVPLIGDGWQILLTLLSLATVDGAKIIAKLEEVLDLLAGLKNSLDRLHGLPEVADAVRAFRANPNRRALSNLSAASATATPSLRELLIDLSEVLEPLKDIAEKVGGLVKGLRSVADAGVPIVSDAARLAGEKIGLIEEPLVSLRDDLDRLHQDIGADVEVLERIQEAVRQAREHEE